MKRSQKLEWRSSWRGIRKSCSFLQSSAISSLWVNGTYFGFVGVSVPNNGLCNRLKFKFSSFKATKAGSKIIHFFFPSPFFLGTPCLRPLPQFGRSSSSFYTFLAQFSLLSSYTSSINTDASFSNVNHQDS